MSVFLNSLIAATKGRPPAIPPPTGTWPVDVYDYGLALQSNILQVEDFYYFRPYRTADYSLVQNDMDYFFMYSTDHGNGGIYWGKGNNLDLSDFVEGGKINIPNYQSETPDLMQKDGKLLLYYHSTTSEPGNNNKQQTRLFTSTGGNLLHLNTWTDEGRPLGIVGDENHTGYFLRYERANDIIGTHIAKGGLPQPWKSSISTDGGYTFTRYETIDVINGTEPGYFAQLSDGQYFFRYNRWWWMGTIHPETDSAIFEADKKLILAKADYLCGPLNQVEILNGNAENLRHSIRVWDDSDIAQVYVTNPKTSLYHGKYDLRNLYQYL